LAKVVQRLQWIDLRGCNIISKTSIVRLIDSLNAKTVLLLSKDCISQGHIPIGFPGNKRGLHLSLKEVYSHVPKNIDPQKPKTNEEFDLSLKRFVKAKVKKNLRVKNKVVNAQIK
jgi:hypothetical protein